MQHFFLLLGLLFALVVAQESECGSAPPTTWNNMPKQKVAYVQIETTGYASISSTMKLGYDKLALVMKTKPEYVLAGHSVTMFYCRETSAGGCLQGIDLASYTQVWVNDNSAGADNEQSQADGYKKISSWYTTTMAKPHLICDGRYRSSLWAGSRSAQNGAIPAGAGDRPNGKYIENLFVNLGVRGGGMFLGTDHAPYWTEGINEVARMIGITTFRNNFASEPWALAIDVSSPVMFYPNDASEFVFAGAKYLWDDSTTSDSPISEQSNGQILYPIGWHSSVGFNRPGVSTTIRGGVGFLIKITSPTCKQMILPGAMTRFTAVRSSGEYNVQSWTWTSDIDGNLGTGSTLNVQLSPGEHTVVVRAVDSQNFVATAKVLVVQVYSSGKAECIMYSQNGKNVREYFPLQRVPDAITYYGYQPRVGAHTADGIETRALSSNFLLYDDGNNAHGLNLILVNSKNVAPATIHYRVSVTTGAHPTITMKDAPNDLYSVFDASTQIGTFNFSYQAATKGVVFGPFPNTLGSHWCFDLTLDKATLATVKTVNTWGHVKDSTAYPSPILLAASASPAGDTTVFQFCRVSCGCAGIEPRHAMSGSIDPVRVNPGAGGNIGETYTGGILCHWSIKPTVSGTKRGVEQAAIPGINIWFGPKFEVNAADSLTIFQGDEATGVRKLDHATGNAVPAPLYIQGAEATVAFTTTAAIKTEFGWSLNYAVQPTIISLAPTRGVMTESTTVTVIGTWIARDPQARVKIDVPGATDVFLPVVWKSDTSFTVVIPPGIQGTFPFYYTNNIGSGKYAGPLNWTWWDASCDDVKTCGGCAPKPGCNFCNNLQTPGASFCFGVGGDKSCPTDASLFKNDNAQCCTGCVGLGGCNKGGACQCNDTCVCDSAHWAADCSCLQCPKGANGKICSGFGTCGCDGKCSCDALHRGDDCGCLKCAGEPGPCSGNGNCNCDGSCTCNAGWTHSSPSRQVCDCSTVCEGNCSGHGVCKCGVCECFPGSQLFPDCSCQDCAAECNENQMCTCNGTCTCLPGFSGPDCKTVTDCSLPSATSCVSCLSLGTDCGWCDGGLVCENRFFPAKCNKADRRHNPRGFTLTLDVSECPIADVITADITSNSMTSILAAAIVGTLGTAAVGLAAMAYFLRAPPVEAFGDAFALPESGLFNDNAIFVPAAGAQVSPAYV